MHATYMKIFSNEVASAGRDELLLEQPMENVHQQIVRVVLVLGACVYKTCTVCTNS